MEIIYVFLIFYIYVFVFIILFTTYKKRRAKRILNCFNSENFNILEIKLSEESYSNWSYTAGAISKVLMYYNENLIIFTPCKNSIFSSIINSLPLIFVLNENKKFPNGFSCKKIEKINIKSNKIILYYFENSLTSILNKEIIIYADKEFEELKIFFKKLFINKEMQINVN